MSDFSMDKNLGKQILSQFQRNQLRYHIPCRDSINVNQQLLFGNYKHKSTNYFQKGIRERKRGC